MRTALIAWDYPPAPSGLSTAAREIAESLVASGADVTVLTLDRRGVSEAGGVRIVGAEPVSGGGVARLRLYGAVGHLAAPLAVRRAILAEHARRPFDVVEATNWYAPACLLARRPPMALVTRNSTPAAFSRETADTLRDRLDGWAADRLEARQARGSHGLISNTADHGRRIAAEYGLVEGDRPHAVIGLSLAPAMLARARAAGYPAAADGEPIRLLFVGRPEHRKGFDAILGAVEILGREADAGALPPFEVRLAGVDGAALDGVAAGPRARLLPLGRLHEDDLAREYEAAHAVLAPSRYESFGLVYQEGMAYGRPMVASMEDASAREFVGATGAGAMARETTGPALAEALRPVIAEPGVRETLRQRALTAAGRFTRETLGRETLALYEEAVARFQSRKG
ncbi:glycosyltransferase family 4 protein [Aureimonas sp. Leaf324]|jgi:glycosyltransferase involved in cell wall biosynthesis|uniref:glycosyltransferase family 4 protein n=1 Tax=Aureimonas sp. Leaf324 TaxID=1736336 RepID=UPI0006F56F7A|nr:glycosyltransferase family 4 protein [Aureimonas sp. Leaf324]KQQ80795.1 glycosyl transferase family 1 [Aureimonas sp. Leaf324]